MNTLKGGVIKIFNKKNKLLSHNDTGWVALTNDNQVISSNWVNENELLFDKNKITVSGNFNLIPTNKNFNPLKLIIFRTFLIIFGWNSKSASFIKGLIRKMLMLGNRKIKMYFKREIILKENQIEISDSLSKDKSIVINKLSFLICR